MLYEKRQNKEMKALLLSADSLLAGNPLDSTSAHSYFLLGNTCYRLRQGEEGIKWHEIALQWREKHLKTPHVQLLQSYEWIGNLYRYTLRQPYPALPYYEKALTQAEQNPAIDLDAERRLTYNLAATYRLIKDMGRALSYGQRSLQIARKTPANKVRLASHLNQMGTLYMSRGEPKPAVSYFQQALMQLPNKKQHTNRNLRYRSNLADAKREIGAYQEAQLFQLENLKIVKSIDDHHPMLGTIFHTLAKGAIHLGDTAVADVYAQKAIEANKENFGSQHPRVAEVYRNYASFFRGNPSKAVPLLDSALSILWPSWYKENEPLPAYTEWESLFLTLGHKASALSQSADYAALDTALWYHRKALQAYQTYRFAYLAKDGIVEQAQLHKWLIEEALGSLLIALGSSNKVSDHEDLYEFAWKLMEAGKGTLLQKSLRQIQANSAKILSDSLFTAYRQLSYQLEKYSLQPSMVDSLYNTQRAVSRWQTYTKSISPLYDNYLRQQQTISFNEFSESLVDGQMIINYWEGEEAVYVLGRSRQKTLFRSIRKSAAWHNSTTLFTRFVRNTRPELISSDTAQLSLDAAFYLYQQLIQPFLTSDINSLQIIPHGALEKVPFEALLIKPVKSQPLNYHQHDYLVRKYSIQYAFSANHAQQKGPGNTVKNMVGIAWGKTDKSDQGLPPLPYSEDEVRLATKVWSGTSFSEKTATESVLREALSNAKIIHLALHGSGEEDTRQEPVLFFPAKDYVHDGRLHLSEIYQMRITSELVILSACQTGTGNYLEGEGTMSLARGFAFAGCPMVVSSLWPLNDGSSSQIMHIWHQKIAKGNWPHHALQKSKIEYLKTASPAAAHPSQWAGVILTGASQPIHGPTLDPSAIALLLLIVIVVAVFFLQKRI